MGIFGIVTATVIVGFLGVYEATHCPVHGRPDPDYIVVLKHRGPDTVQLHLESFERGFDIEPHIKDIFTNLASLNVHAYVISDVDCLAVLQSASTVEYIERVSYFSVLPTENCNDSNDVIPDGDDYEIPDFSKSPLTTFLSSDSACTLSYEHFRHFANLPEESLLSPRSVIMSPFSL